MSHPLPVPPAPLAPLPDAAVRLVRLSRAMTRGAVYIVLVVLCALVLASVATSRYVEAAVAACVVGYVLFAVTAVRGRKA